MTYVPGCARCGLARADHDYNGGAYGACGVYVAPGGPSWSPPKVVDQPKFGAASQYVVARLDEISEGIVRLAAAIELLSTGRRS